MPPKAKAGRAGGPGAVQGSSSSDHGEWLCRSLASALKGHESWMIDAVFEGVMSSPTASAADELLVSLVPDCAAVAKNVVEKVRGRCVACLTSIIATQYFTRRDGVSFSDPRDNSLAALPRAAAPAKVPGPAAVAASSSIVAAQPPQASLGERRACNCLAVKHGLYTNCLRCGRITCAAEGEGPCFFCGVQVDLSIGEAAVLRMPSASPAEASTAAAFQSRLVGYDRDSARRTTIIDDQAWTDIDANSWLSGTQREQLRQEESAQVASAEEDARRRRQCVTIDLIGRRVYSAAPEPDTCQPEAPVDYDWQDRQRAAREAAVITAREAPFGGGRSAGAALAAAAVMGPRKPLTPN